MCKNPTLGAVRGECYIQGNPCVQRSEWRGFLNEQKAEHARLTDAINTLETRMNEIVYDAFALTPEERHLIEETTKYPYGEV